MADTFAVKLEGAEELQKVFELLPVEIRNKVVPQALRFAAKPIIKDAQRRVMSIDPDTAKSIGQKLPKKKNDATRLLIIGPTEQKGMTDSRGRTKDPRKIAHLIEGKTKAHGIKPQTETKIGKHVGRVAGGLSGTARVLGPMSGFQIEFAASVHHPGTEAHPFMRPAFDANWQQCSDRYTEKAWRAIESIAKRLAKKTDTVLAD